MRFLANPTGLEISFAVTMVIAVVSIFRWFKIKRELVRVRRGRSEDQDKARDAERIARDDGFIRGQKVAETKLKKMESTPRHPIWLTPGRYVVRQMFQDAEGRVVALAICDRPVIRNNRQAIESDVYLVQLPTDRKLTQPTPFDLVRDISGFCYEPHVEIQVTPSPPVTQKAA